MSIEFEEIDLDRIQALIGTQRLDAIEKLATYIRTLDDQDASMLASLWFIEAATGHSAHQMNACINALIVTLDKYYKTDRGALKTALETIMLGITNLEQDNEN